MRRPPIIVRTPVYDDEVAAKPEESAAPETVDSPMTRYGWMAGSVAAVAILAAFGIVVLRRARTSRLKPKRKDAMESIVAGLLPGLIAGVIAAFSVGIVYLVERAFRRKTRDESPDSPSARDP